MSALDPLLLAALLLLPALGAAWVNRARTDRVAWGRAVGIAVLTLLLALALSARSHLGGAVLIGPEGAPWLAVDRLGALYLPFIAFIALSVCLGGPRVELGARSLPIILLTEALLLCRVVTVRTALMAVIFALTYLPGFFRLRHRYYRDRRDVLRTYAVFLLGGTLPFAGALLALHFLGVSQAPLYGAAPVAGANIDMGALPHGAAQVVLLLVWLGVLMRMAVPPLHSWLPVFFEKGPLGVGALLTLSQPATVLIVRIALPLANAHGRAGLGILADLALVSALYGALLALVQRDIRRMLGLLVLSQSGLLLVGFAADNAHGITGALLHSIAIGLSLTGLTMTTWGLWSRTGTTDLEALGGVGHRAPRLAAAFLTFGLAAVGLPGSLSFVAEDLLSQGVLAAYPMVATAIVVSTAANGISVMRTFVRAFLGAARERAPAGKSHISLLPREQAMVSMLLVLIFGLGLLPGPLTAACDHIAGVLAQPRAHPF